MPSQQSTTTASAARKAERMDAKALTALDQWIGALPQSGMDSSSSRDATSDAGTLGTRATFVTGLASGEVPQHLLDLNLDAQSQEALERALLNLGLKVPPQDRCRRMLGGWPRVSTNSQKRGSKVRPRVSMVWQVALDMFQVWEE